MGSINSYRLPRHSFPRRYDLELVPFLEEARYDGTVSIDLHIAEPTRTLDLNSADLVITSAVLDRPDGSPELDGQVSYDQAEQQVTIAFDEELAPADGYRLTIVFHGLLNDQLHGFYRSVFQDSDGQEQVIATTQFEPSDARRAFPCWDEPDFKAVFNITLVVSDGLTAISNGPEISAELLDDGRRRITFGETMPMSTYLVAFVVGPYETTPPVDVEGVPLRIAAVPGRSHLTTYAKLVAEHSLRFLSGYFEIPYPGTKIDHIAIPDFAFGAMENLGCVTYRESVLLADPDMASQTELQRIAIVVAHETAHMWFGDLVTMRWWNGIWLNEAFATFMENTTIEAFNPEWEIWTTFGAGKSAALATDGLRSTRPVEFAVGRPEEAEAMFDVLTYQKGGAVLRMLEQYLGPETFRKGIGHYLRAHAYGNTETTDLWDALEAVSGEPVRSMMDSWIFQAGYPIVHVDQTEDPSTISLRQQRFLYDAGTGGTAPHEETWAIPVTLRASSGGAVQQQRLLLDQESVTLTFNAPVDWVVVNDGAWGFYRVRYSPELWSRIQAMGVGNLFSSLERLELVVDTWAAVDAGLAELGEWVDVVQVAATDDDPDVWTAVYSVLLLLGLIADDDDQPALDAFIQRIADPVWESLGWEPRPAESRRSATARARLLSVLGLIRGDSAVKAEAAERFRLFLEDRLSLAPDVVAATARIAVGTGAEESWSTVLDQYRAATVPQDKLRYLYALAETDYQPLLQRTLDMCLTAEVRTQDAPFLIAAVMSSRAGGSMTWEWVESNWTKIENRYPSSLLARILEGAVLLLDPEWTDRVQRFCATNHMPFSGPRLEQILERMRINVALAARLRGTMTAAFGQP